MIAYIDGKLTYKDPTYVIIDVGGVGYHIKISLQTYTLIKNNERCKLHTYLHIKEDAHTLFGFYEQSEKNLFLLLISISGIGPSIGLMVLSSLSSEEIQAAIVNEDLRTIQQIKGIGTKTAQRIILELKDKLKRENITEGSALNYALSHNTIRSEALSALITLGINKNNAEKAVDNILKKTGKEITLEELIKLALKSS